MMYVHNVHAKRAPNDADNGETSSIISPNGQAAPERRAEASAYFKGILYR